MEGVGEVGGGWRAGVGEVSGGWRAGVGEVGGSGGGGSGGGGVNEYMYYRMQVTISWSSIRRFALFYEVVAVVCSQLRYSTVHVCSA